MLPSQAVGAGCCSAVCCALAGQECGPGGGILLSSACSYLALLELLPSGFPLGVSFGGVWSDGVGMEAAG